MENRQTIWGLPVDSIPLCSLTLDASGHVIGYHGSLLEITGLLPEHCVGRSIGVLFADGPIEGRWIDTKTKNLDLTYNRDVEFVRLGQSVLIKVPSLTAKANAVLDEHRTRVAAYSRLAAIREMAAGVAHEINNPLAIISNYAHLIAEQLENAAFDVNEVQQYCKNITDSSDRIAAIVLALKTFTQDPSKEDEEEVSLEQACQLASDFIEERAKKGRISLELDSRLGSYTLRLPKRAVAQALTHLLTNSLDEVEPLAEPHKKWIRVLVREVPGKIEILVEDGGPGVLPENRIRLFEPFFTTKPLGKGTGVGLSQALGIAHQVDGDLKYDPHADSTRFIFSIPSFRRINNG